MNQPYLEFIKSINIDYKQTIIDKIHSSYALWITNFDVLLYVYNLNINNVPSSIEIVGFLLSITTHENDMGLKTLTVEDRYKNIFSIFATIQNTGSPPQNVRRSDVNIYNDILTYYAYNLNEYGIDPEIITAVILSYIDYKVNSDILFFMLPPSVNQLLPDNKLLSKNNWETFYENIVPFFAAFKNTNILTRGPNRPTRRRQKRGGKKTRSIKSKGFKKSIQKKKKQKKYTIKK